LKFEARGDGRCWRCPHCIRLLIVECSDRPVGQVRRAVGVKAKKGLQFDPIAFLAKTGEGRAVSNYAPGQVIFAQGDPADAVFYVQAGRVKLTIISAQGKEAVVGIYSATDFFGEASLAGQLLRIATATAMNECRILRISKAAMLRILHDETSFSELFVAHLLSRNIRVEADLVDQLFNSSEKRLARVLLLLANFGKEGKPEAVIPKITQETLAEMIGTTRSRVSFFMNKFRKLGFIEYNGKLSVHSSLLNVVLHD
jgi:CRP/FNR family transcriptional regulator, cyclic AMP receptor protein